MHVLTCAFLSVSACWHNWTTPQGGDGTGQGAALQFEAKSFSYSSSAGQSSRPLYQLQMHEVTQLKDSSHDAEDYRFHYFSALNKVGLLHVRALV